MPERRLIQIPSDEELSSPTEWQRGPDRNYYAYRYHLLIEERRGSRQLAGPAIDTIEVASGVKYNFQIRKLVTIRFTETIQDSITRAVSNKLTHDVSSKTISELGAGANLLSSKFGNEIQTRWGVELTASVQELLSNTKSYEIQNTEEITKSITIDSPDDLADGQSRFIHIYPSLWPWHWNVYLYEMEFLSFKYQRKGLTFWRKVRTEIAGNRWFMGVPLFRIDFYEPRENINTRANSFTPDVENADEIKVTRFQGICPAPPPDRVSTFDEIAEIAFPPTGVSPPKPSPGKTVGKPKPTRKGTARKAGRKSSGKASAGGKPVKKGGSKGAVKKGASHKKTAGKVTRRK
jgi:hypothetical protein